MFGRARTARPVPAPASVSIENAPTRSAWLIRPARRLVAAHIACLPRALIGCGVSRRRKLALLLAAPFQPACCPAGFFARPALGRFGTGHVAAHGQLGQYNVGCLDNVSTPLVLAVVSLRVALECSSISLPCRIASAACNPPVAAHAVPFWCVFSRFGQAIPHASGKALLSPSLITLETVGLGIGPYSLLHPSSYTLAPSITPSLTPSLTPVLRFTSSAPSSLSSCALSSAHFRPGTAQGHLHPIFRAPYRLIRPNPRPYPWPIHILIRVLMRLSYRDLLAGCGLGRSEKEVHAFIAAA